MSISRANLPDAVAVTVSQKARSRKSTPTDDTPSQKPNSKTMAIRSGSARGGNAPPQSVFPSSALPTNLSPNPHLPTHSPTQYIQQDLPIHPAFDHASSSTSPQDLKRKRADADAGPPVTTPTSLAFYTPLYVGSQPFLPDAFENPPDLSHQGIPTTGATGTEPFGEHMETFGFPYYYEN